ncbi:MAG: CHAP domain-containing protein [Solobacterium sp.]|nr:CHAP domain-containing protein [Solobacterium sp.]
MLKQTLNKLCAILAAILLLTSINPLYAEGEDTYYTPNPYYGGWSNCTWGAWQLAYEATGIALPGWHMAYQWADEARAAGFTVSMEPRANSIGVWNGHVVYVTDFDGQNIYLKEGGFLGGYNEGWADGYSARYGEALLGYIYLDGEVAPYSIGDASEQAASASAWGAPNEEPILRNVPSNVEVAIAPEIKEEDIENLELEVVKKYDNIPDEPLKQEEEAAIKDVQLEDAKTSKSTPTKSTNLSVTFLDVVTTFANPLKP